MPFSIPANIENSILQAGPWAALFLLSVLISGLCISVLYKAARESDNRAVASQRQFDEELKRVNTDRIEELKKILDVEATTAEVVKELARTVEVRAQAISQMADTLSRVGTVMEANQKAMMGTGERLERINNYISQRVNDVWHLVFRGPVGAPQPPPPVPMDDTR